MITEKDLEYLKRCVELAEEALVAGDKPFGSIIVSAEGKILFEDRNRVVTEGDETQHPEISIARWAAKNLSAENRKTAVVYTSGEHCSMCSAAHGWVGLGRIVYASSSAQLGEWFAEMGVPASSVKAMPIQEVISNSIVEGPVLELSEKVKDLHKRFHVSK